MGKSATYTIEIEGEDEPLVVTAGSYRNSDGFFTFYDGATQVFTIGSHRVKRIHRPENGAQSGRRRQ